MIEFNALGVELNQEGYDLVLQEIMDGPKQRY